LLVVFLEFDGAYCGAIRVVTKRATYAALLWLLTMLFAMRVLGQALQRWVPQPLLPPFDAFQGSNLPYWLLLLAQLAILVVMIVFARCVQTHSLVPSGRAGTVLMWAGWIYMSVSIGRIAVGLSVPTAPAWFSTWIPAIFHVLLAAYVLTLAYYHRGNFARR
jgi:hypothetical protein